MKIIKERMPETIIDRYIEYTYKDDPHAGFVFPALPNGEPDFEHMPKEAILNYNSCLDNDKLNGPKLRVDKRTYINPAVGKCSCGAEVILDVRYDGTVGAVMCDNCGKWYNLFGQELRDPEYWEQDEEY